MLSRGRKALIVLAAVGVVGCLLAAAYGQTLPASLRYGVVAERSEARYRVREQLVGFDFPNDAVGVTRAITGGIALDDQGRACALDPINGRAGPRQQTEPLGTLASRPPGAWNPAARLTLGIASVTAIGPSQQAAPQSLDVHRKAAHESHPGKFPVDR